MFVKCQVKCDLWTEVLSQKVKFVNTQSKQIKYMKNARKVAHFCIQFIIKF